MTYGPARLGVHEMGSATVELALACRSCAGSRRLGRDGVPGQDPDRVGGRRGRVPGWRRRCPTPARRRRPGPPSRRRSPTWPGSPCAGPPRSVPRPRWSFRSPIVLGPLLGGLPVELRSAAMRWSGERERGSVSVLAAAIAGLLALLATAVAMGGVVSAGRGRAVAAADAAAPGSGPGHLPPFRSRRVPGRRGPGGWPPSTAPLCCAVTAQSTRVGQDGWWRSRWR